MRKKLGRSNHRVRRRSKRKRGVLKAKIQPRARARPGRPCRRWASLVSSLLSAHSTGSCLLSLEATLLQIEHLLSQRTGQQTELRYGGESGALVVEMRVHEPRGWAPRGW